MATSRNLFSTTTSATTYPSITSPSGEIDLRAWFDNFIFGSDGGLAHGQWHVIRHMRHDSNDEIEVCSCLTEIDNSPSPDCPYCDGEGYLWDEQWYMGYSTMSNSDVRTDHRVFYFRYDVPFRKGDKIKRMKLDTEGKVVVPYEVASKYTPETISEMRSDTGRLEYWAIWCLENDPNCLDVAGRGK